VSVSAFFLLDVMAQDVLPNKKDGVSTVTGEGGGGGGDNINNYNTYYWECLWEYMAGADLVGIVVCHAAKCDMIKVAAPIIFEQTTITT